MLSACWYTSCTSPPWRPRRNYPNGPSRHWQHPNPDLGLQLRITTAQPSSEGALSFANALQQSVTSGQLASAMSSAAGYPVRITSDHQSQVYVGRALTEVGSRRSTLEVETDRHPLRLASARAKITAGDLALFIAAQAQCMSTSCVWIQQVTLNDVVNTCQHTIAAAILGRHAIKNSSQLVLAEQHCIVHHP